MYCPQCKSEYREGITVCAECQVPLVESVPEDEDEFDEEEPAVKVLLETSHPTTLEPLIVKLEEKAIPYILQSGTALSLLEELMPETLPEDWRAIVLVPSEHFDAARVIVAEVESQSTVADTEEE